MHTTNKLENMPPKYLKERLSLIFAKEYIDSFEAAHYLRGCLEHKGERHPNEKPNVSVYSTVNRLNEVITTWQVSDSSPPKLLWYIENALDKHIEVNKPY